MSKLIDQMGSPHSYRCPKCNAGPDTPCAYPDFNFRDCPMWAQIKEKFAGLAAVQPTATSSGT